MLNRTGTCLVALACLALNAAPASAQEADVVPSPSARQADVASIDAILAAVYDVISGPAGERDWDRFRSLFIPEARLIAVGMNPQQQFQKTVMDVDGYISRAGGYFMESGFFESEIARRAERFGHVAHAFSTYESRHRADDTQPFSRGINSFQLMNDGERWWIVTIYWQAETPELSIPDKYLP